MESEYSMTLPKYDNSGRHVKPSILKKYAVKMAEQFGGVSVIPSILGCWVNDGKLQCEENIKLTSSVDSSNPEVHVNALRFVRSLAKQAGKDTGQDSIFVTDDALNDVMFVKGKYSPELPASKTGYDIFTSLLA